MQPITIRTFSDNRGNMKFIDNNKEFQQQFISINKKDVIRGIHCSPYPKIVTCLSGFLIDYIINLDEHDPNYLSYKKYELTENQQVFVPANYGHVFVCLLDNTTVLYQ